MNRIFLPELLSVEIENYTLYAKSPSFRYDFIKGVNLIIGGNGVGKTTFVNIVKYALIGLYKKEFDYTRTYMGRKIEKRVQIVDSFFANRTGDIEQNKDAKVTLTYKVADIFVTVERGLVDIGLKSAYYQYHTTDNLTKNRVLGHYVSQSKYERLSDSEKPNALQYNYESLIASKCGVGSFDDLIFFVNEILFFGEDHKTILWNDEYTQIQSKLTSKYFNEPEVDNKRQDALRQEKYFDSKSRHTSEDMRVLNQLVKDLTPKNEINKDLIKFMIELEFLKTTVDSLLVSIETIHQDRTKEIKQISAINKQISEIDIKSQALEAVINEQQRSIDSALFVKINPKYDTYLEQITRNDLCPMCNQDVDEKYVNHIKSHPINCFLCNNIIPIKDESNKVDSSLLKEMEGLTANYNSYQNRKVSHEEKIEKLDKEYESINRKLFSERNKLRQREHLLNTANRNEDSAEIDLLKSKLLNLDEEKNKYAELSREMREEARRLSKLLEEESININSELSSYFSDYANKFLGLETFLSFEDYDGYGRRFVPVIDNKPRLTSDELSESQRFFVDHSFRMSLLNLFYQTPAFFICETPDSSLDISYEQNAAEVFLLYLNKPNVLILTSNLNNSSFLEFIIEKAESVKVLNLFDYGKMSPIQKESVALHETIAKITDKINRKNA